MDKNTFFGLLDKYTMGTASPGEKTLVEAYYRRLEAMGQTELGSEEEARLKEVMYQNIMPGTGGSKPLVIPLRRRIYQRIAVAAAIFLLIAGGSYFLFFNNRSDQQQQATNNQLKDIPPGRNVAILTLANGQQVLLDSTRGTITQNGGITVINAKGLLSYEKGDQSTEITWHTISIPRGGQYQLLLADGSKVWLNSASTLRYPTAFTGKNRLVELTGEGYFEVAHNASQPFRVNIPGKQEVEVLGTHFNINAYEDETIIKTTLLEGSVKVNSETGSQKSEVVIKPGEQAQLSGSGFHIINDVDIMQVIAWQNGLFEFSKSELPAIMRQISRWYDINIVMEGKPGQRKFGGSISRNLPLSEVLHLLEANGVKFRLDGKTLIVEAQ